MTGDYLSNLITKSLDAESAIQPRPAALFEPPSGAVPSAYGHLSSLAPQESERAPDAVVQDQPPARQRQSERTPQPARPPLQPPFEPLYRRAEPASAHPIALPSAPPRANPETSEPEPPRLPAATSRPDPIAPQTTLPLAPAPLQPAPEHRPRPRTSERPQPPVETTREAKSPRNDQDGGKPTLRTPRLRPRPKARSEGPSQAQALEPVVQRIVVERVLKPVTPQKALSRNVETQVGQNDGPAREPARALAGPTPATQPSRRRVTPQVKALAPPEPAPRAETPQPESPGLDSGQRLGTQAQPEAPTIQVTIGRIEVRATPPPAPAPKKQPQPRPPAMSLDDYLRRRTNGGTR